MCTSCCVPGYLFKIYGVLAPKLGSELSLLPGLCSPLKMAWYELDGHVRAQHSSNKLAHLETAISKQCAPILNHDGSAYAIDAALQRALQEQE